MFSRKKKEVGKIPRAVGPKGDPWDKETLAWLGQSKQIDISITHIERKFGSGEAPFGAVSRSGNTKMIVTGFLKGAPQHVEAEITFNAELNSFGDARLTYWEGLFHPMGRVNLPRLRVILCDSDCIFQKGLIEAMRDALSAGQTLADVRLWVDFEEGWDHTDHEDRGWFSITGAITWSSLYSSKLTKWAFPGGEGLASYPDLSGLRAFPAGDQ